MAKYDDEFWIYGSIISALYLLLLNYDAELKIQQ